MENNGITKTPAKNRGGITLSTSKNFIERLWFFITNPFRYLFTGKIRY